MTDTYPSHTTPLPVDVVQDVAERAGWSYRRSSDDRLVAQDIQIPGVHTTLVVLWNEPTLWLTHTITLDGVLDAQKALQLFLAINKAHEHLAGRQTGTFFIRNPDDHILVMFEKTITTRITDPAITHEEVQQTLAEGMKIISSFSATCIGILRGICADDAISFFTLADAARA